MNARLMYPFSRIPFKGDKVVKERVHVLQEGEREGVRHVGKGRIEVSGGHVGVALCVLLVVVLHIVLVVI